MRPQLGLYVVCIAGYEGATGIGELSDAGLSGMSSKQSRCKKKRSMIGLLTMLLFLFLGENSCVQAGSSMELGKPCCARPRSLSYFTVVL